MVIKINYTSSDVYVSTSVSPVYVVVNYSGTSGGGGAVWGGITGTLSDQTDLQDALDDKVPYTGATANVDLGEYELKAGQLTLDTTPTGTAAVGTTRWNDTIGSSETTLKGGNVILKNGVDLVARVVNKVTPNTTLTKASYQAVKVSGAQGQRLAIALAQANNDANSADTIGLVTETIAANQEGFIMTVGNLEGINTTGSLQGETWADGDVLYLSPTTAGVLTNVKPTGATGHIVVIGYVEYAHANNGKIYVKIMNGWELDELHNVYISSVANNDALIYESATSLWKNKTIATALGYTPVPTTRTLTINGTAYDLSADRSWTVSSAANTIYTADGTLTGNRVVTSAGYTINFDGSIGVGGVPLLIAGYNILNINGSSGGSLTFSRAGTKAVSIYNDSSFFTIATENATLPIRLCGNYLDFSTTNTLASKMRLTSAGRLLLGTTTEGTYLLDVNGTARVSGALTTGNLIFGENTASIPTSLQNTNKSMFLWNLSGGGGELDLVINSVTGSNAGLNIYRYSNAGVSTQLAGIYTSASRFYTNAVTFDGTGTFNGNLITNSGVLRGGFLYAEGSTTSIVTGVNGTQISWNKSGSEGENNFISLVFNNVSRSGDIEFGKYVNSTTTYTSYGGWKGTGSFVIGSTTSSASAVLEAVSSTRGFLPPRMTTAERDAISSPATGLQIYNTTTNENNTYNGTAWVAAGGGSNIYTADGTLASARTVTSGGFPLTFTGSNTAALAIARGLNLTHTLVAAANNDVLVGLDVNPTFTNGAFTGVKNFVTRLNTNSSGITENLNLYNNSNGGNSGTSITYRNGFNTATIQAAIEFVFATGGGGNLLFKTSNGIGLNATTKLTLGTSAITSNVAHIFSGGIDTQQNLSIFSGTLAIDPIPGSYKNVTISINGSTAVGSIALAVLNTTNAPINTNTYGLYVSNTSTISGTGVKYGVYSNAGLNVFTGNTVFGGTTDAGYRLDVNGTARYSGRITSTVTNDSALVLQSTGFLTFDPGGGNIMSSSAPSLIGGSTTGLAMRFATGIVMGTGSAGYHYISVDNALFTAGLGAVNLALLKNSSAVLQADSTTKGFLPPRGTNTQMLAIASPVAGLMFYDTTNNKLNCYDGTTWQACW